MRLTTRNSHELIASPIKVPLLNGGRELGQDNRQLQQKITAGQARHPGGRPHVPVDPEQVRRLRDRGASWRQIARALRIGTATAMRLYNALSGAPVASQNSQSQVSRS